MPDREENTATGGPEANDADAADFADGTDVTDGPDSTSAADSADGSPSTSVADSATGLDSVDALDPADALSLPAHEIRVGILETLWDAAGHSLPYAELRKRVGVRDSGQFNYHLSKLEGTLIGHTDEEYHLVYPGHRLLDAVLSGAIHQRIDPEPRPVEGECAGCGGGLAIHYENYHVWVTCADCERVAVRFPFDPAGIANTAPDELPIAFDRSTRSFWRGLLEGVCQSCSSPVATELVEPDAPDEFYEEFYAEGQPVIVGAACEHCSIYGFVPAGVLLLTHPEAVGWLYERGVDVRERRLWQLLFVVDPDAVTVLEESGTGSVPDAVVVEAHAGGETLRAIVDGSASIVALERPEPRE